MYKCLYSLFLIIFIPCGGFSEIYLRDNIVKAQAGDYIVTAQNKQFTLFHIKNNENNILTIEEITVPQGRIPKGRYTWKTWVESGAPYHTNWVKYKLDVANGHIFEYFSLTQNRWRQMSDADNFLTTLLNLKFYYIPESKRKKIGTYVNATTGKLSRVWQPKMVIEGITIPGVEFNAWKSHWPNDGSDLAGKSIEVYLPKDYQRYPSYFPYWLQVSGFIGKAKIRIIDTGTIIHSNL